MGEQFDKDDVLRFLYDEMEPAEQDDFLLALTSDDELWQTFEELKAIKEGLNTSEFTPSGYSCTAVMNYVKKPVKPQPVHNLGVGRNNILNLQTVVSAIMIVFTSVSIAIVMHCYNSTQGESLYSADNERLQWENPHLDYKLGMAKMNLRRLSGERETPFPVYQNTYRVVNTNDFSTNSLNPRNIVLLNLH